MDSATIAVWAACVSAGAAVVSIGISVYCARKANQSSQVATELQRSQLAMARAKAGTTLEVFATWKADKRNAMLCCFVTNYGARVVLKTAYALVLTEREGFGQDEQPMYFTQGSNPLEPETLASIDSLHLPPGMQTDLFIQLPRYDELHRKLWRAECVVVETVMGEQVKGPIQKLPEFAPTHRPSPTLVSILMRSLLDRNKGPSI